MEYLILATIIVIAALLIIRHSNKRKLKKRVEQIRSSWSEPKTEKFFFNRIKTYSDSVKHHGFHRLTEQTIADVDIFGLFTTIDRTTSKVGQQYLFKKLIEPTSNLQDPSKPLIELFTNDPILREKVQIELLKLNHSDAYNIPSLLQNKLLETPKWITLAKVNLSIMIGMLLGSIKFPVLMVLVIFPYAINMILHYWNKTNALQFITSFPQLNLLIQVSNTVSRKADLLFDKTADESVTNLRLFQRYTSLINFDNSSGVQGELGQLASYFIELIKAFFLIEVFTLFKVIRELETKQQHIITLFNYIGSIDASISVVSLRAGTLQTCEPVLVSARKELFAKNMYHPAIKDCKHNSIIIADKSVLITGSNMSGKSTFLRTITINSILAQTIHTCFADEFITPVLKQFTSIRIDDDLFEGKSYFFKEVEVMGSLIANVEHPYQNLFILDEVFKGTNTVERVASAKALLSYLNQNNNIVIVSTHDIELSHMLHQEYDLYHFTEAVENNQLYFDYIIKPGQLRTTNAIKILELSNYPTEIIREARRISETMQVNQK